MKQLNTLLAILILGLSSGCSKNSQMPNDSLYVSNGSQKKKSRATTYALRDEPAANASKFYNAFAQNRQTYLFTINGDQLEAVYLQELDALAGYLCKHTNQKVHLDGFTCELGSSEYNIALGYRRAQSLAKYLQEHGVNRDQIIIVSYGKEKPVDRDHNEAAWSKNRRVEAYF